MNAHARTFEAKEAVRESVPLLIGLMGPSGSGKTFSALRLATGQAAVDQIMLDAASAPGEVRADAKGPHRLEQGGYVAAVRLDRLSRPRDHEPFRTFLGSLRGSR
jgi:hypothetical protein